MDVDGYWRWFNHKLSVGDVGHILARLERHGIDIKAVAEECNHCPEMAAKQVIRMMYGGLYGGDALPEAG
jgi:regulator of sirC expression with transglutaminase-like and TPR domain